MTPPAVADASVLEFYRLRVRVERGSRVRTRDLAAAYEAWAIESGHGCATYRQLGRVMRRCGHRHFQSNGVWYADAVVLGEDQSPAPAPTIGDLAPADRHAMTLRIESLAAELDALRVRLSERAP